MMDTLKILIVSQKGGVGKSTFSTNFAAWCGEIKKLSTLLLDFDPHASSSLWLSELSPKNVNFRETSSNDFSSQRWFIGARAVIRKADSTCSVAIADVTWTKGMNSSFLNEFDLVVVPTSVSQIDLDATNEFILKNLSCFSQKKVKIGKFKIAPALILLPSMVTKNQLKTNPFTQKNFDFPFLLLPPVPYDEKVRLLFKKEFIHNTILESKNLYEICFESLCQAGKVHLKEQNNQTLQKKYPNKLYSGINSHHTDDQFSKRAWSTKRNLPNVPNIARIMKAEANNGKTSNKKKSWLERIASW